MRAIGMDPDARGAQADLARRAGINPSILSRWIAGSMQPGAQPLRELAHVLRVRPVDLMVAAGRLDPADVTESPRTAEESISQAPGLSEKEKGELLGYLARMRERTGFHNTHPRESDEPDEASETNRGNEQALRDATG
jgi:transcriptional regulator with XRE-family HTH domain